MKRVLVIFSNFILILAAVACVMGAIISAFSFTVDVRPVFWCWFAAALALSVFTTLGRGKALLIMMLPALALLLWKLPDIMFGAKWVVSFITGEFNVWIDVPFLFPEATPGASAQSYFFAAAGVCLAFPLSFSICLRRSALLVIVITIPLVLLTFVLTIYQPNLWYILGLLAVILTLMISGAMHPDDFEKRGAAVFPALALALVLLVATYILTMTDNSRRGDLIGFIDDRIRYIGVQAGFTRGGYGAGWPEIRSEVWQFDTDYVRISSAGARVVTGQKILDVRASQAGTYYLKGYSMQQFDGRAWHGNPESQREDEEIWLMCAASDITKLHNLVNGNNGAPTVNMSVSRVGDKSGLTYLPYYIYGLDDYYFSSAFWNFPPDTRPEATSAKNPYSVGFVQLDDSLTEVFTALPQNIVEEFLSDNIDTMRQLAGRIYRSNTRVEDSTAEALRKLAIDAGIDPYAERAAIADSVAAYISSAARYNLSPIPIPINEDFALFFLQRSRQGYCIHFATTATLMLRALDVPARFTTGFVVKVPEGKEDEYISVTDREAHAWVEVFYDDIGWVPLEVTPSTPASGIPAPRPQYVPSGNTDNFNDLYDDDYYPGRRPNPGAGISPPPTSAAPESSAQQDAEQRGPAGIWKTVCISASGVAACLLLLALREYFSRKKRDRRFSQEDPNEAVICMWRYVSRLLRNDSPPDDVVELALKARFSQHRISDSERAAMLDYAVILRGEIYGERRLPGRLWLKYIRLC